MIGIFELFEFTVTYEAQWKDSYNDVEGWSKHTRTWVIVSENVELAEAHVRRQYKEKHYRDVEIKRQRSKKLDAIIICDALRCIGTTTDTEDDDG